MPDHPDLDGDVVFDGEGPVNCCLGFLSFGLQVRFFDIPGDPNNLSWVGLLVMRKTTVCIDIRCDGLTWNFPYYYSCENEVEQWNSKGGLNTKGIGYYSNQVGVSGPPAPAVATGTAMAKLGCCEFPCDERSQTSTYIETGTIDKKIVTSTRNPDGSARATGGAEAVLDILYAKYGFGGEIPPVFPPCCGQEGDNGGSSGGSTGRSSGGSGGSAGRSSGSTGRSSGGSSGGY